MLQVQMNTGIGPLSRTRIDPMATLMQIQRTKFNSMLRRSPLVGF